VLAEALAAGGTAVVQAAGTDARAGFRAPSRSGLAPGDTGREQVVLERRDRTAAALEAAGPGEVERVQARQETSWQTLFEILLEGLQGEEQRRAADELRDRLARFPGGRAAVALQDGVAVAGDVNIHAGTGGAAALAHGQSGSADIEL
jgi:hypothetical protein